MTSETTKLQAKLATLNVSLDELETQLEPLFAKSLPETVVGLETIQQAKLQVLLPYLVYDLVFIYLKSRGIDPRTHPVIAELDRVRQYFDKVKGAEQSDEKKKYGIDKAAAGRFIKHAIAQAKDIRPPVDATEGAASTSASTSNVHVPVTITSKMAERAEYERKLKEEDSGEGGEDLQVFDEASPATPDEEPVAETKESKKMGKKRAVESDEMKDSENAGLKRRRPRIDPFTGHGENDDSSISHASPVGKEATMTDAATEGQSGRSTPSISEAKKQSKASKKSKRKPRKSSG